jgi:hypothetical protein
MLCCYHRTIGVTENALEDTDPIRQWVDELGHQTGVLDSQQELNAIPSHRERKMVSGSKTENASSLLGLSPNVG